MLKKWCLQREYYILKGRENHPFEVAPDVDKEVSAFIKTAPAMRDTILSNILTLQSVRMHSDDVQQKVIWCV